MNMLSRRFAATACALLLAAAPAAMAGTKEYQVTGPIISMTDTSIVIQKGKEQWEVSRDATTKGAEALKVGDKVTVHYTMSASSVEPKAAKSTKKDAPAPSPAAAPKA